MPGPAPKPAGRPAPIPSAHGTYDPPAVGVSCCAAAQPETRIRGPFEAFETASPAFDDPLAGSADSVPERPVPASPSQPDPAGAAGGPAPGEADDSASWSAASVKMEQIKDLYLTAEAIGDDALSQYFQQVSERQRQLIREYFDEAVSGGSDQEPPA